MTVVVNVMSDNDIIDNVMVMVMTVVTAVVNMILVMVVVIEMLVLLLVILRSNVEDGDGEHDSGGDGHRGMVMAMATW